MKIAILGYGIEGRSAYEYWHKQGAGITICDQSIDVELPADVESRLGNDYLKNLQGFDIVCRTASISPVKILAESPGIETKLTTVINEFLRVCPTSQVIGITGTKGKGTTSTLVKKMLEAAGHKAILAGNIGLSPLSYLELITPETWVVLELSSYQLQDIAYGPKIAACLMVEPDHLNWHGTFEAYTQAKANLFRHQHPDDTAIYFADSEVSHKIAGQSPGKKIPYFANPGAYVENNAILIDNTVICETNELKLLGDHNWQNACAAATIVWQVTQNVAPIRNVLISFEGLAHRLEFVREHEGISYFNDSFASTPPAASAALGAIQGKKIMILGGFDRQLPLENLVDAIQEHQHDLRAILLIGESKERLATLLKARNLTFFHLSPAHTMTDIVHEAQALAEKGDSVVLSPGFPSFDMFKDFEDRGLQFKQEVHNL